MEIIIWELGKNKFVSLSVCHYPLLASAATVKRQTIVAKGKNEKLSELAKDRKCHPVKAIF